MVDRRNLLAGVLATPIGCLIPAGRASASLDSPQRPASAVTQLRPGAAAGGTTTETIARFAELSFDAVPTRVAHAARRYILDGIGCALAGWNSEKGRLAALVMAEQGGSPVAGIMGSSYRLSAAGAAFANAELMNALDYDALPHTPPVTLPALLAAAEANHVSGARLLSAEIVAHEVANRLQRASSNMISTLLETGRTPEVFGINTEGILATAAALGGMLRVGTPATVQAMGIAGYYCPPQGAHSWETLPRKTHVKYTPVGWICQGAVTAVSLASKGFTGDPAILDHAMAFPRFYGWERWEPDIAVGGLGESWTILDVDFKPHAACRFTHSQIDCMQAIVRRHGLTPDAIAKVETLGLPFVANPEPYSVTTQEGCQFSTPYVVALAAHGIPLDAKAYDASRMQDPSIRATMAKIRTGIHPDSAIAQREDMLASPARVTVTKTSGEVLSQESRYPIGTGSLPNFRLSDDALSAKFLGNAMQVLPRERALRLRDALWSIDRETDVASTLALASAPARS